jgi:hypothetical protein
MKQLSAAFAVIAFLLSVIAAWATHVIVCINSSAWVLLVVGIVVPPIGYLHGVGIWFGFIHG